jgi:hypothetical protein
VFFQIQGSDIMHTKIFSKFHFFVLLAFSAALIQRHASAQVPVYNFYTSPTFYHNQTTYPQITYPSSSTSSKSTKSSTATKPKTPVASPKSTGRASLDNNPLPYKRDRALSAKIREEFLAEYARQVPDEAATMRATAERTDFVQIIAGYAQLQGLDSGTMEGLMAYWYGQAWAIAHQRPLPSARQFQGIEEQLRRGTPQTDKWSKMTNAERQTFFEQIAHPLFLQRARYQSYLKEGKKDYLVRMASATQEGLKKIGLDMQSLQLSDNGFVGL